MRVKLLISRSGPNGAFSPGDEIDVSDAQAKRMFEASPPQAVPVREAVAPERAVAKRKAAKSRKAKT